MKGRVRAVSSLQPGQICDFGHPDACNGPHVGPLAPMVLNDDALREIKREKRIQHKPRILNPNS